MQVQASTEFFISKQASYLMLVECEKRQDKRKTNLKINKENSKIKLKNFRHKIYPAESIFLILFTINELFRWVSWPLLLCRIYQLIYSPTLTNVV